MVHSKTWKQIREAKNSTRRRGQKDADADRPCTIFILIRVSDKRRRDLDNAVNTVLDALVQARAIADDSVKEVSSINAKVAIVPRGREGVDVMIID